MSLGTNIRNIRESRNIKVEDISKRLKIFEKAYNNIEKNLRKPSDKVLREIASFFNLTVDDIINYNEQKANIDTQKINLRNLQDVSDLRKVNKDVPSVSIDNINYIPVEDPTLKDVISKKSILLDSKDLYKYRNNINLVGTSLSSSETVGSNQRVALNNTDSDRVSSPRLLSYVEPYVINGVEKSLFYTEVNTNYNIGDRVFIIGGEYDIDLTNTNNRYKKGRDGYKVLFIDRCKIVLDIDYTGKLPYRRDKADNFLNIYKANSQSEFELFSKQISTRGGVVRKKFAARNNNILFTDKPLDRVGGWGGNDGINFAGFYVIENDEWVSVTIDVINGNYDRLASLTHNNNGRIKINNGNVTYRATISSNKTLEDDKVYKWDDRLGDWIVDDSFDESIITKSNFRGGNFNGNFNGGVYGTKTKKIKWEGTGTWNLGTLLNCNWVSGIVGSRFTLPNSFLSEFGSNNKPYQKVNGTDNNGSGFNFLFKSDLSDVVIENGNIYNTSFGIDNNKQVTENYVNNNESEFNFELNGGFYNNCTFKGGKVINATLNTCRSFNSLFENITSVNSNFKKSVLTKSNFLGDNKIKVLDYDEFVYGYASDRNITHKVYKFYISEASYKSLKIRDKFYIKDIRINEEKKYPLNFFNKRFKISTWTEYVDFYNSNENLGDPRFYKRGFEVGCFLSTPGDNEFTHTSFIEGNNLENVVVDRNNKNLYSLDIMVSVDDITGEALESVDVIPFSEIPRYGLNMNNNSEITRVPEPPTTIGDSGFGLVALGRVAPELTKKVRDYVDISNAYIINSDFDSGLVSEVDWVSGDHIEYNNDNNIKRIDEIRGYYDISFASNNSRIRVKTNSFLGNSEADEVPYEVNDIVFLNNIEYMERGGSNRITLPDTHKVISITEENGSGIVLELEPVKETDKEVIINIPNKTGVFTHTNSQNRYTYVHKTKFDKSKISGGIFRRSFISNSLISNDNYNTNDVDFRDLSNIKSLVVSDGIFKNCNNTLSKATYVNSNFSRGTDNFIDGIIYNSNWDNGEFNGGVFKESCWNDGVFNDGIFYNNKSFNNSPNQNKPSYNVDSILSYYKSGEIFNRDIVGNVTLVKNDRHSWISGLFNNGDFTRSDFEDGTFNGGNFYNSVFYQGLINGGIFGKQNTNSSDTLVLSGTVNNVTVNNSDFIAKNPNLNIGNDIFIITWNGGIFNNGRLGTQEQSFSNRSQNLMQWNNGEFNGGEIIGNSIWKDGKFNGGKFSSNFGSTFTSSTNRLDFAWQNGEFNGGTFGTGNSLNNPMWFQGEFNGGEFRGKIWNNGIFTGGTFRGYGTAFILNSDDEGDSANDMVSRYLDTQAYFGIWRNGVVSERRDVYNKNKKYFTRLKRNKNKENKENARIIGALWLGGIFDHKNASMERSVWLNGRFKDGNFIESSFNPYVRSAVPGLVISRSNGRTFNKSSNCIWENGKLERSNFFYSDWKNGIFDRGNSYGMHWENGVCLYMDAYNIFWENGKWKNGNWNGSYIDYKGSIESGFYLEILKRGNEIRNDDKFHLWNIFKNSNNPNILLSDSNALELSDEDIIIGDF